MGRGYFCQMNKKKTRTEENCKKRKKTKCMFFFLLQKVVMKIEERKIRYTNFDGSDTKSTSFEKQTNTTRSNSFAKSTDNSTSYKNILHFVSSSSKFVNFFKFSMSLSLSLLLMRIRTPFYTKKTLKSVFFFLVNNF